MRPSHRVRSSFSLIFTPSPRASHLLRRHDFQECVAIQITYSGKNTLTLRGETNTSSPRSSANSLQRCELKLHMQVETMVRRLQRHARERTDAGDSLHHGSQAAHAVGSAMDIQFMRPHIQHRRPLSACGIIRKGHLHAVDRRGRLHAAVKYVHIAQKVHHERVRRMIEYFVRRADLFDTAWVHHHDPVGHFKRLFLIVRDEHAGHVDLVVQLPQPARSSCRTLASSAPNGSSSSSTLGRIANARAKATRCRWPPESCDGIAAAQAFEPHQMQ